MPRRIRLGGRSVRTWRPTALGEGVARPEADAADREGVTISSTDIIELRTHLTAEHDAALPVFTGIDTADLSEALTSSHP